MSGILALFKSLLRVFFSVRSILYLFFRLFPLAFGLIYYQQRMNENVLMNLANYLQKAPYLSFLVNLIVSFDKYFSISICKNIGDTYFQINSNLYDLFWFVVFQHYFFELIHILSSRLKNQENQPLDKAHEYSLIGLIVVLLIYSIYFYFTRTGHVTNYKWTMLLINIAYFLINIASSVTLSLFEFAFFFSEGLIMMQYVSDNIANEYNFEIFMLYLPILLIVEALFISIQLKEWREEGMQSFSRVIGKHDSILLYMVFFGVIYLINVLDMFHRDYLQDSLSLTFFRLGIPLLTIPYAFWVITKALASENKTLPINTLIIVIIYISLYMISLLLVCNHASIKQITSNQAATEPNDLEFISQGITQPPDQNILHTSRVVQDL